MRISDLVQTCALPISGHGQRQAPAESRFRVEPASLPRGVDIAGAQEFRLRVQPRTRALGFGPVWVQGYCRPVLARIFFQQNFQERLFAKRAPGMENSPPECEKTSVGERGGKNV